MNSIPHEPLSGQDYQTLLALARTWIAPDLWRAIARQRFCDSVATVGRRASSAAYLAIFNWAIVPAAVPIWRADGSVICSCWLGERCPAIGKHPLVEHSAEALPTAPPIDWLTEKLLTPTAGVNPALLAGQRSGRLIIGDIDPRHGGALDALWAAGWPRNTPIERTGGGGWHVLARWPYDGAVPNAPNYLPGVELKGDGLLVVVSPARHASGGYYRWLQGHAPWQREVATLPDSVAQSILAQAPVGRQARDDIEPLTPDTLNEWRDVGLSPRQVAGRAESRYERALERVAQGEHRKNVLYLLAAQLYGLGLPTTLVTEWCEAFVAEVYE